MNFANLTPTEKMILLSLQIRPEMTLDDLMAITGTGTRKYMFRTLRTLVLCGKVERTDNSSNLNPTFKLVVA
jgi:hypothetical protein